MKSKSTFCFIFRLSLIFLITIYSFTGFARATKQANRGSKKSCGKVLKESHSTKPFWDADRVVKILKVAHERGYKVTSGALQKSPPYIAEISLELYEREAQGNGLVKSTRKFFGSFNDALIAAGIDPESLRTQVKWSQEIIVNCIKSLHEAGLDVHASAMGHNKDQKYTDLMKEFTVVPSTGQALYISGRKHFDGSWDKALEAAGLNPRNIRKLNDRVYWDKVDFSNVFQTLKDNDIPLNYNSVSVIFSDLVKEVLTKELGITASGNALVLAVGNRYESWDNALIKAGFNPDDITMNFWNEEKMIKAIQAFHKAKIPLNSAAIQRDHSKKSRDILKVSIGRDLVGGSALYHAAFKHFKSWDLALLAAGLPLVSIRKASHPNDLEADDVIKILTALEAEEIHLRMHFLLKNAKKVKKVTYRETDKVISPRNLYLSAIFHYGSWENALASAQIEFPAARKRQPKNSGRRRAKDNLPIIDYQEEWVDTPNGPRLQRSLGASPLNPEEILEETDAHEKLEETLQALDEGQQMIVQVLLVYLEENEDLTDQEKLLEYVLNSTGEEIDFESVQNLILLLSRTLGNE